ncbi:decarboxylating 6-phosphogluconate dehydrogenase [Brevibacillus ruminantium]|uniref:Decarboxylating 6-phosphogluconate dehydrogenase n=1 Tax=Brevibacillus ruminantium TaxID=2950604 RepID=A0ABY4WGT7_9BACL|nr:decarboxylating 6-phosphogluconate dehydrogenase [Brevibacillus ruminantium]USG65348.1 decarboxylating 6-phosphogluconate dehydrogenase [Brevibacillus ruminantium]
MHIGVIGLGKMGMNLVLNMKRHQAEVSAFDISAERLAEAKEAGVPVYEDVETLVQTLATPRAFWMMIPAGSAVDEVLAKIKPHLRSGDIVIDGGNSHFKDSVRRHEELAALGVDFLDVGSSGGTSGALNGLCLMIGGPKSAYDKLEGLFIKLAVPNGCLYTGEAGSGHFLKMVHNGIEYGMMQAIAEGFEVLEKGPYTYDYEEVATVWNNGSVIRSWLMELMQNAFSKDERLDKIRGVMHSSGEGKWTIETALDYQVATPVIALSLLMRYRSLQEDTFAGKVVAALRNEFGGHAVVSADES